MCIVRPKEDQNWIREKIPGTGKIKARNKKWVACVSSGSD